MKLIITMPDFGPSVHAAPAEAQPGFFEDHHDNLNGAVRRIVTDAEAEEIMQNWREYCRTSSY